MLIQSGSVPPEAPADGSGPGFVPPFGSPSATEIIAQSATEIVAQQLQQSDETAAEGESRFLECISSDPGVGVRERPSMGARVLRVAISGDVVEVLEYAQDNVWMRLADGWVRRVHSSTKEPLWKAAAADVRPAGPPDQVRCLRLSV